MTDGTGNPLAGAKVTLQTLPWGKRKPITTDEHGAYTDYEVFREDLGTPFDTGLSPYTYSYLLITVEYQGNTQTVETFFGQDAQDAYYGETIRDIVFDPH